MNDLHNLDWSQHIMRSSCEDGTIRAGTVFTPTTTFFSST